MSEEHPTFTDLLNGMLDDIPEHLWFSLTFGKEMAELAFENTPQDPDKLYVMKTKRDLVHFDIDPNQEDFVKFNWYNKEETGKCH